MFVCTCSASCSREEKEKMYLHYDTDKSLFKDLPSQYSTSVNKHILSRFTSPHYLLSTSIKYSPHYTLKGSL